MKHNSNHPSTEPNEMDIIFAGTGGQGVQTIGLIIATAAMMEDREVLFRPDYEGKIRTGISNCVVSISETAIWSPGVLKEYDMLVALNENALRSLEERVKPGGILIWEAGIKERPKRHDLKLVDVHAYKQATDVLGNVKVMNMIVLGAILQAAPMVKKESVIAALSQTIPSIYHHLIPLNEQAIDIGLKLKIRN